MRIEVAWRTLSEAVCVTEQLIAKAIVSDDVRQHNDNGVGAGKATLISRQTEICESTIRPYVLFQNKKSYN